VLAPTGTIGFMMDCDTTGVEPDIALVKYKLLVGGGMLKIVNRTVPMALEQAGLRPGQQSGAIIEHIDEKETIEGAPGLRTGAPAGVRLRLQAAQRQRSIAYPGHIR
jgi:ribonucleoside-diphosphate reductase alpha chain